MPLVIIPPGEPAGLTTGGAAGRAPAGVILALKRNSATRSRMTSIIPPNMWLPSFLYSMRGSFWLKARKEIESRSWSMA